VQEVTALIKRVQAGERDALCPTGSDLVKIRPGQLVVVDQSVAPPETVWRLFHMQVTAINDGAVTLSVDRNGCGSRDGNG